MSDETVMVEEAHSAELVEAAEGFAAVGSEPRLALVLSLVRAGPDGLTVGEIQDRLGMAGSTLTHHLRALVTAGLVVQERQGRSIYNRANFDKMQWLAAYLLRECCADVDGGCP